MSKANPLARVQKSWQISSPSGCPSQRSSCSQSRQSLSIFLYFKTNSEHQTVRFYLDFSQTNSLFARPPFEIGFLSLLNIFWLGTSALLAYQFFSLRPCKSIAFNSFSTSRWRHVPMACSAIPDGALQTFPKPTSVTYFIYLLLEFADERVWCRDVQALKAFVWIEFAIRTSPPSFSSTHPFLTHHLRKCSSHSPTHSTSCSPNSARATSTSGGLHSPATQHPATPAATTQSPTCVRDTGANPASGHLTGACSMEAQRTELSGLTVKIR